MRIIRWLFFGLLLLPAAAMSQGERARDWEAGFHFTDFSSLSLGGFRGAALQVEGNTGYGFAGAYNFTNRLAAGVEMNWRNPSYRATFVPELGGPERSLNAKMDVARLHFKGIYYFLESRFTPFVEVAYGWTRIDSNIIDGPPITGCWWDPWWGFICRTSYTTYAETEPSYGAALGVRWDLRGELALRGSIGTLTIDRARGVDNSSVDTTQFEVIWRF